MDLTWTILALSLEGASGPKPSLLFPSYAECSAMIDLTREAFEAQGLAVIGVHCIDTPVPIAPAMGLAQNVNHPTNGVNP